MSLDSTLDNCEHCRLSRHALLLSASLDRSHQGVGAVSDRRALFGCTGAKESVLAMHHPQGEPILRTYLEQLLSL